MKPMNAPARKQIIDHLAFIGFGEAASAFVAGWSAGRPAKVGAYDIKTDSPDDAVRAAKLADYQRHSITGAQNATEMFAGTSAVFSTVTADQALAAARWAAAAIEPATLYLDCNSCAPETKRAAAAVLQEAGVRYVDAAIMAPVYPRRHRTPVLLSGEHAPVALELCRQLDMRADVVDGPVGTASSIKMIRSVMMKGLEALVAECVLAGRKAGVDDKVLDSLEATYPGFGWRDRTAYMLERMMTHGIRRSAEMREVAKTVDDLGIGGTLSAVTADWQERIGALRLDAQSLDGEDYGTRADALLRALDDKETVK